jgi:hypothetical protein
MNFEGAADLAGLAHLDRFHHPDLRRLLPDDPQRSRRRPTLWWKLASIIITCGTLAGALIPELVKVFTSTNSRHVKEVVTARAKAALRSTSSPASWPATSAPTGWAWSSSLLMASLLLQHHGLAAA